MQPYSMAPRGSGPPSDLDYALAELYGRRARCHSDFLAAIRLIDDEIRVLLGTPRGTGPDQRPHLYCLRCGHRWQGRWPNIRPRCCARCHSSSWDTETDNPRARQLDDLPNPRWNTYKTARVGDDSARPPVSDGLPPPPLAPRPFSQPLAAELARLRTEPQPESVVGRAPAPAGEEPPHD